MRELILKLFRENGTMGVKGIAEMMGEEADLVRHEVNRMTEEGLLIKCGAFIWKIPEAGSKYQPKPAVVLPEVVITRKTKVVEINNVPGHVPAFRMQKQQYTPDELLFRSPTDDRTIEEVLSNMRKRLQSKPLEVQNLKQKITVLEGLADITEAPISTILTSIGDDLIRFSNGG